MAANVEPKVRAKSDDVNLLPVDTGETSSALQALLDEQILANDPAAAEAKRIADEKAAADAKAAEAAKGTLTPEQVEAKRIADEKAAADAAEAQRKSDEHVPSLTDTVEAEAKRLADEKAAEAAAAVKPGAAAPTTDVFDSVVLPTNAKSATTQSFNSLKELARKTAADVQAKLDAQTKEFTEATEKLKLAEAAVAARPGTSPEVLAELEDLRKFKLSQDATSDPEFTKFDDVLKRNDDRILRKLAEGGVSEASIEKIKELGGFSKIEQEDVLKTLPLHIRRSIESILVQNEDVKDQRADALTAAKAKGAEYLTERAGREAEKVTTAANGLLKSLPWTVEKSIPATATAEQKAEITAGNEFARSSLADLKSLLSNRSPEQFAELAVCTILAGKHKADLLAARAKLAAIETTHTTATKELTEKLAQVTKERDEHAAKLLKIKQSAMPRGGGEGRQVTSGKTLTGIFDTRSPSEALEQLRIDAEAAQNA